HALDSARRRWAAALVDGLVDVRFGESEGALRESRRMQAALDDIAAGWPLPGSDRHQALIASWEFQHPDARRATADYLDAAKLAADRTEFAGEKLVLALREAMDEALAGGGRLDLAEANRISVWLESGLDRGTPRGWEILTAAEAESRDTWNSWKNPPGSARVNILWRSTSASRQKCHRIQRDGSEHSEAWSSSASEGHAFVIRGKSGDVMCVLVTGEEDAEIHLARGRMPRIRSALPGPPAALPWPHQVPAVRVVQERIRDYCEVPPRRAHDQPLGLRLSLEEPPSVATKVGTVESEFRRDLVGLLEAARREAMKEGEEGGLDTANRIQATIELIEQGDQLCAIAEESAASEEDASGKPGDHPSTSLQEVTKNVVVHSEFRARQRALKRQTTVHRGLAWLADHQDKDGKWDSDKFMKHDAATQEGRVGAGQPEFDVGVTALALLAFLESGETTESQVYEGVVAKARDWLLGQQDRATGLIGEKVGHSYLYCHGIATQALCKVMRSTDDLSLKEPCERAVGFIAWARNEGAGWRYESPPDGTNDTSVTGWMLFALYAAKEAGISVPEDAIEGGLIWIDHVTNKETGRVGYNTVGSPSSRMLDVNDQYPTDKTECMTAIGLHCRLLGGKDVEGSFIRRQHADLLKKALPPDAWEPNTEKELSHNDMYYWYHWPDPRELVHAL
ncbi:MAG: terpene cyclase/mutase family protein, partial [Planctomycetota bacterium]|nr:terpene cyclase/mutase family protein [Planctomycetota bacterium]